MAREESGVSRPARADLCEQAATASDQAGRAIGAQRPANF